jgi:hypothetical protein
VNPDCDHSVPPLGNVGEQKSRQAKDDNPAAQDEGADALISF